MQGKGKRKVITDTGIITLPAPYRAYHKISKGDFVEVSYNELLVVKPQSAKLDTRGRMALKVLLEG